MSPLNPESYQILPQIGPPPPPTPIGTTWEDTPPQNLPLITPQTPAPSTTGKGGVKFPSDNYWQQVESQDSEETKYLKRRQEVATIMGVFRGLITAIIAGKGGQGGIGLALGGLVAADRGTSAYLKRKEGESALARNNSNASMFADQMDAMFQSNDITSIPKVFWHMAYRNKLDVGPMIQQLIPSGIDKTTLKLKEAEQKSILETQDILRINAKAEEERRQTEHIQAQTTFDGQQREIQANTRLAGLFPQLNLYLFNPESMPPKEAAELFAKAHEYAQQAGQEGMNALLNWSSTSYGGPTYPGGPSKTNSQQYQENLKAGSVGGKEPIDPGYQAYMSERVIPLSALTFSNLSKIPSPDKLLRLSPKDGLSGLATLEQAVNLTISHPQAMKEYPLVLEYMRGQFASNSYDTLEKNPEQLQAYIGRLRENYTSLGGTLEQVTGTDETGGENDSRIKEPYPGIFGRLPSSTGVGRLGGVVSSYPPWSADILQKAIDIVPKVSGAVTRAFTGAGREETFTLQAQNRKYFVQDMLRKLGPGVMKSEGATRMAIASYMSDKYGNSSERNTGKFGTVDEIMQTLNEFWETEVKPAMQQKMQQGPPAPGQ